MTLAELMNLAIERAKADGMRLTIVVDPIQPAAPQPIEWTNKLWTLDEWSGFVNKYFEFIESRLAALESTQSTPAPAQTRTHPAVEWDDFIIGQTALVGGQQIGTAYTNGTVVFFGTKTEMKDGNVESAKAALESKFRRWWDELHNLNSTTQTT